MNGKILGCAILSAGALALGACQSTPTRIYTLEEAVPATRLDSRQLLALRVDSLSVPAGWDRIEILRPSRAGSLEISELDHWSAPLREAARQALSADLSERLPSGSVIYPRLPKPNGALGIDVDILEFSLVGSHASMQASWVIIPAAGAPGARTPGARAPGARTPGARTPGANPAGANPPEARSPGAQSPRAAASAAKRSEAALQYSMSSAQPAAVVRAWSDLIGQLADRIAADAAVFQTPN